VGVGIIFQLPSKPNSEHHVRGSVLAATLATAFLMTPSSVSAQSAQLWSLQFSGLGSAPFGGAFDNLSLGHGWEAQLRVNPSAWSFGFGVEQTSHDVNEFDDRSVNLLGGFLEPRFEIFVGSSMEVQAVRDPDSSR